MKRTAAQVLADTIAAVIQACDVTDALARLVGDCGEVLSAGAVGLFVRSEVGQIEVLSSTSHAEAQLGLFEMLTAEGPCVDALSSDGAISVTGPADILARWPGVGQAIIDSGYQSVHASPMRWRGEVLGAMNALFVDEVRKSKEQVLLAQSFADVAALVVMQIAQPEADDVSSRIRSALSGRAVIEQAKGVIAFQQTLEMCSAYDVLVSTARREGTSLTATAEGIVSGARRQPETQ